MYQLSRCIYRDLAPRIDASEGVERTFAARRTLLEACEATIQRLVSDRRYFARPAKTLFTEVREHFALAEQVRVYMVIEHHLERLEEFLDSLPDDVTLDGPARNAWRALARGHLASASRCRGWTTAPRTSTSRRPRGCARSKSSRRVEAELTDGLRGARAPPSLRGPRGRVEAAVRSVRAMLLGVDVGGTFTDAVAARRR